MNYLKITGAILDQSTKEWKRSIKIYLCKESRQLIYHNMKTRRSRWAENIARSNPFTLDNGFFNSKGKHIGDQKQIDRSNQRRWCRST